MRRYHLLPAVAGDLHCRAGRHEEARQRFLQAASPNNSPERSTMQGRAAECASRHAGTH